MEGFLIGKGLWVPYEPKVDIFGILCKADRMFQRLLGFEVFWLCGNPYRLRTSETQRLVRLVVGIEGDNFFLTTTERVLLISLLGGRGQSVQAFFCG